MHRPTHTHILSNSSAFCRPPSSSLPRLTVRKLEVSGRTVSSGTRAKDVGSVLVGVRAKVGGASRGASRGVQRRNGRLRCSRNGKAGVLRVALQQYLRTVHSHLQPRQHLSHPRNSTNKSSAHSHQYKLFRPSSFFPLATST